MLPLYRMLSIAGLLTLPASALYAQALPDPSGHWQGVVQAPDRVVEIEIDLANNSKGQLAGTFTQLADHIKGLPFATVTLEGRSLTLVLRAGSGGGTFNGKLGADGKSIDGDFVMKEGGYILPFTLKHTGDARIPPEPNNPAIAKEFEGTWNGALDVGGRQMRLSLTLTNQPDGTAEGTIVNEDGSGLSLPLAITQNGASITLEVMSVGATFTGKLDAAGAAIEGEFKQGSGSLPLTLRK